MYASFSAEQLKKLQNATDGDIAAGQAGKLVRAQFGANTLRPFICPETRRVRCVRVSIGNPSAQMRHARSVGDMIRVDRSSAIGVPMRQTMPDYDSLAVMYHRIPIAMNKSSCVSMAARFNDIQSMCTQPIVTVSRANDSDRGRKRKADEEEGDDLDAMAEEDDQELDEEPRSDDDDFIVADNNQEEEEDYSSNDESTEYSSSSSSSSSEDNEKIRDSSSEDDFTAAKEMD